MLHVDLSCAKVSISIMGALECCGRGLGVIVLATIVMYAMLHAGGGSSATHAAEAMGDEQLSASANWLRLHPPRQASHDAELLRRRMLAQLVELSDDELEEHVLAIVASLDHADDHVRNLAIDMLARLRGPALKSYAAALAERLESEDERVRQGVIRSLAKLAPLEIARHADAIVEALADAEPSVRWAAVDALSLLEPNALANITLPAIDMLVQQQDLSIARAAVGAWAEKLSSGATEKESYAHAAVLDALSRLGSEADLKSSGSSSMYMQGSRYNG